MVIGYNDTELFQDTEERKILYLKKTDIYYQLTDKDERFVRLLQGNLINSVSISLLIGMFVKWSLAIYVIAAVVIYVLYLLYFNKKIFPHFKVLNDKKIERKNAKPISKSQAVIQAVGFWAIGGGLIYCLATGQVEEGTMEIIVYIAMSVSALLGIKSLMMTKNS